MPQSNDPRLIQKLPRLAGSLLIIAGITTIYTQLLKVNSTTVALSFLLAVLGVATQWGLAEAILASVAGVLCFNFFFLEPTGTFTIADPQNWVAFFAFLVTSVVASELSARVRRRALEALRRQQEMERLYDLSRGLMLLDKQSATAGQVAARILDVFGLAGVAVFDREEDRVFHAGAGFPITDSRLRDAALQATAFHDAANSVSVLPLQLGGDPVGGLAILATKGESISDAAWHAVANLAAIAMEKARAEQTTSRIEATRQNEAMKATLLDALAHEFTTPLTSIKAAASSILDEGRPVQQELVTIIEEETDRLDTLVRETIRMGRIEAGSIRLNMQPLPVAEFIANALQKLKSLLDEREIQIDIAEGIPAVMVDPEQGGLALRQLLTNALKYSNPNSPIAVRAGMDEANPGFVIIRVKDNGPGIPEKEFSRIFEKFYRVPDHSDRVPGTGMGLNIAREIIRAHGGDVGVESQVNEGSEFFFSLPCAGRPS